MKCLNGEISDSCDRVNSRDNDCCRFPRHPKPSRILLECGTRPQDAIFETGRRRRRRRRDEEFILDRVVVDTSCLCRPQVKIDFACIVCFEAEATNGKYGRSGAEAESEVGKETSAPEEAAADEGIAEPAAEIQSGDKELEVELEFELIRVCNGVEETVRKWIYLKEFEIEYNDDLEVEISESFNVTFCDRECPGCCVYKMKVTLEDLEGDFDELRVVSPSISVLAQGICGD